MSEMTDEIIKRSREGLLYLQHKLKDQDAEIERLRRDLLIATEELERERRPKQDER